jgi:hypothetical protein
MTSCGNSAKRQQLSRASPRRVSVNYIVTEESWYKKSVHPAVRAARHAQYGEAVPDHRVGAVRQFPLVPTVTAGSDTHLTSTAWEAPPFAGGKSRSKNPHGTEATMMSNQNAALV